MTADPFGTQADRLFFLHKRMGVFFLLCVLAKEKQND